MSERKNENIKEKMSFETLLFDVADNVATITLNRPDKLNALNYQMAHDLLAVAIQCDERRDIRAVVITGAGDKAFCSGGDLHSFHAHAPDMASHLKSVTLLLHGAISRFTRMDAPVIVAINGVAAGAGISFVGFPDLAIASSEARFVSAYTGSGLTPDGSSTYFLPRIIGQRRYLELAMTNRMLSADEAAEWGLVNKVVPPASVMQEAHNLATTLAAGPSRAFGRLKDMVHQSFGASAEGQMELEARMLAESTKTEDGQAGIAAFVAKTKPVFSGK